VSFFIGLMIVVVILIAADRSTTLRP